MEEKDKKFSVDTEELKNQTVETAKKVKESVKNTNIKENTIATKGFIKEMFKNPLGKIKEVSNDNSGKYFKISIFLIIIWTILVFIDSTYTTIYYWGFTRVFNNILSVLKDILAPLCGIVVYSLIVLAINKGNKKPLSNIVSTITITKLPLILASLVSLLTIFSSRVSLVTSPLSQLCSVLSIIFGYFGLKSLFNEEENKNFIKKYILIQIIYYIVYILIGLLGIYI